MFIGRAASKSIHFHRTLPDLDGDEVVWSSLLLYQMNFDAPRRSLYDQTLVDEQGRAFCGSSWIEVHTTDDIDLGDIRGWRRGLRDDIRKMAKRTIATRMHFISSPICFLTS